MASDARRGNLNTSKTWAQIARELQDEFRKWGIPDYHLPYKGDSVRLGSVSVAVKINGEERVLTCNRFHEGNWPERNYLTIVLAVRAARLAEQRGLGSLFAAAAQLISLPEPNDPRHILGVSQQASEPEILRAYRRKLLQVHPDHGGTREELERVMDAGKRLGVVEG